MTGVLPPAPPSSCEVNDAGNEITFPPPRENSTPLTENYSKFHKHL